MLKFEEEYEMCPNYIIWCKRVLWDITVWDIENRLYYDAKRLHRSAWMHKRIWLAIRICPKTSFSFFTYNEVMTPKQQTEYHIYSWNWTKQTWIWVKRQNLAILHSHENFDHRLLLPFYSLLLPLTPIQKISLWTPEVGTGLKFEYNIIWKQST